MRGKIVLAGLVLVISAGVASAQGTVGAPYPTDVNCSGIVTTEQPSRDTYVITGEQSNYQVVFDQTDYVYINAGQNKGVKEGDEYFVIRPVTDSVREEWTKWQFSILNQMGTVWEDEARLKVVVVRGKVSIAQVEHLCDYVQRGDIVLPFEERPMPPLKSEDQFERFARPSGKPLAMVITSKKFEPEAGTNDIVYVNLGSAQGVKVGDYFRIFRYQGVEHETPYLTHRFAFDVDGDWGPTLGLGSSPSKWNWTNVPREILGEGIVLRTGPNSSTVLITLSLREVFAGDYVEME